MPVLYSWPEGGGGVTRVRVQINSSESLSLWSWRYRVAPEELADRSDLSRYSTVDTAT